MQSLYFFLPLSISEIYQVGKINTLNVFKLNIHPMWENEDNSKGGELIGWYVSLDNIFRYFGH